MSHTKKVPDLSPHEIYLSGHYGADVYRDRLARDAHLYHQRGLMAHPQESDVEAFHIRGFANVLNQAHSEIVISHPRLGYRFAITQDVGPKIGYYLSCGDYIQHVLDAIGDHVHEGAHVLDVGAGLGVSSVAAAKKSGHKVRAVEPLPTLHHVIHRNMELNKVAVDVLSGCVVAGQKEGETPFHVAPEVWSSSLFAEQHDHIEKTIDVPVLSFEGLLEGGVDTAIVDVQGAEIGLFHDVDLTGVTTLILALHTPLIGERATASIINTVMRHGFELADIKGWVFVFNRRM